MARAHFLAALDYKVRMPMGTCMATWAYGHMPMGMACMACMHAQVLLPLFIDGLREAKDPFRFLAVKGVGCRM